MISTGLWMVINTKEDRLSSASVASLSHSDIDAWKKFFVFLYGGLPYKFSNKKEMQAAWEKEGWQAKPLLISEEP